MALSLGDMTASYLSVFVFGWFISPERNFPTLCLEGMIIERNWGRNNQEEESRGASSLYCVDFHLITVYSTTLSHLITPDFLDLQIINLMFSCFLPEFGGIVILILSWKGVWSLITFCMTLINLPVFCFNYKPVFKGVVSHTWDFPRICSTNKLPPPLWPF